MTCCILWNCREKPFISKPYTSFENLKKGMSKQFIWNEWIKPDTWHCESSSIWAMDPPDSIQSSRWLPPTSHDCIVFNMTAFHGMTPYNYRVFLFCFFPDNSVLFTLFDIKGWQEWQTIHQTISLHVQCIQCVS